MKKKLQYSILFIVCILMSGCIGNWFKPDTLKVDMPEFNKKEAKAKYERMSKEELIQACLTKDKNIFDLHEENMGLKTEHEGLKSWQRFAFYVFAILCFGAAIAFAQLNMGWVSKGAAGLGVVCLFAPTIIVAVEKIGHHVTIILTWGLYIIGFLGLCYVVWRARKAMLQMAEHDRGLKDVLKEKVDEEEYNTVLAKIQKTMDKDGLIAMAKDQIKG
jgi:hypothetical protein